MLPRNRDWEAHGKHALANKRAGNTPAQTPALLGLTFKPDRARHGDHKHRVGRGGSTAVLKPPRAQALQARLAPCLVCHGDTGRSENPEVPSLGGQPSVFPDPALRLSRATTPSPRNSRSYLRPSPPGRPTRRAWKRAAPYRRGTARVLPQPRSVRSHQIPRIPVQRRTTSCAARIQSQERRRSYDPSMDLKADRGFGHYRCFRSHELSPWLKLLWEQPASWPSMKQPPAQARGVEHHRHFVCIKAPSRIVKGSRPPV
jgi:hypothetical protein